MIHVAIHASQYPNRVREDLIECLRARRVKHKFHYDSYKQAQKWLALHEAHSPAAHEPGCLAAYDTAFSSVADGFGNSPLHVIGLGCGGGQKDAALLQRLKLRGNTLLYTAVDVSLPLVITARQRVEGLVGASRGLVCDLEAADDLHDELCECSTSQRIITFFGMMPNSEPGVILPRLRKILARGDSLLIGANLAPGTDYAAGVHQVLRQYDNALTAEWLLAFPQDLGIERGDGDIQFAIEKCGGGLLRIRADFVFRKQRAIKLEETEFSFKPRERLQLFYSYRYTPELLKHVLSEHELHVQEQWLAPSGEEGVFMVKPGS